MPESSDVAKVFVETLKLPAEIINIFEDLESMFTVSAEEILHRLSVHEKSSELAEAIFNTIYEWRSQELEVAILGELGFLVEFLELWKAYDLTVDELLTVKPNAQDGGDSSQSTDEDVPAEPTVNPSNVKPESIPSIQPVTAEKSHESIETPIREENTCPPAVVINEVDHFSPAKDFMKTLNLLLVFPYSNTNKIITSIPVFV